MNFRVPPVESYLRTEPNNKNYSTQEIAPEETVTIYRSPLAYGPSILIFLLVLGAGIYTMVAYPRTIQHINIFGFEMLLPLSGLPALVMAFIVLHQIFDGKYIISEKFVRGLEGLMSLRKDDVIVELAHIRGIEIHRGLYGRLVNTGELAIGTAAQEDEELTMHGVYNPSRLRDIILQKREQLYRHREDGDQEDE